MEAPLSLGLFGGYPGCNTASDQFRNANVAEYPYDLASTHAEREDHIGLGITNLGPDDVLYMRYEGAAGYGDPLDRDPRLVLHDVLSGYVTDGPARTVYGVIFDPSRVSVDERATHEQRLALRNSRLDGRLQPGQGIRRNIPLTPFRIGEYLQATGSGSDAGI